MLSDKKLNEPLFCYRFVINLLITNLLSSVLLIPLLLVDQDNTSKSLTTEINNQSTPELIIEEDILSDPTTNSITIIQTSNLVSETNQGDETKSMFLCYFAQSITSFICTASIFSILLIGINQYFGVIHSLRYHFYVNRCRSSILIGISWFVALFFAVLSFLSFSDSSMWHFCKNRTQPSDTVKIINTVYALSYFLLVILAPFIAICVIYVCIYSAAHQNSERMRRSASAPLNPNIDYIQVPIPKEASQPKGRETLPKVHSAPNFSNLEDIEKETETLKNFVEVVKPPLCHVVSRTSSERSSNSFISTLRHKISNASMFRYREETRAAKISILVIFLVLVCYVPYGLTLILSSKCIRMNTSQMFNNLSLVLLVFSNIISPFLFGYRNKRVKREIAKMFGLVPGSKQHLDIVERPRRPSAIRNRSFENVHENFEHQTFCEPHIIKNYDIPEVIVTCKPENERKSILKRVCNTSTWTSYKKCNFITVPDSCISGEARGSFSSASTQMSTEE